jgi:tetratricopeptide (TPR) repeat protein
MDKEPVFEKLRSDKLVAAARAAAEYGKARQMPDLPDEELLRIARERAEAAPDHALAYYDQGRALRRLRRYAEAETVLRKAASGDELGRALAAQGKLEEALAVTDEMLGRVAVYVIAGKRDTALQALQALLEKHPDRHSDIAMDDDFAEFRRLPAVQDQLRKARAKIRK